MMTVSQAPFGFRSAVVLLAISGIIASRLYGEPTASQDAETAGGWIKCPSNPVLGGEYGTCFDICVLKDGGVFRMWFSWRPKASIALVESKDGRPLG